MNISASRVGCELNLPRLAARGRNGNRGNADAIVKADDFKTALLTSTTLNVLFNVSPHFHKQVFEFFDDLQVNVDERASVFFQALRNGRATIHAGNMF